MEDETLGNSLQEVLNGRATPKFPREMVASHEMLFGSRFSFEYDYSNMGTVHYYLKLSLQVGHNSL